MFRNTKSNKCAGEEKKPKGLTVHTILSITKSQETDQPIKKEKRKTEGDNEKKYNKEGERRQEKQDSGQDREKINKITNSFQSIQTICFACAEDTLPNQI